MATRCHPCKWNTFNFTAPPGGDFFHLVVHFVTKVVKILPEVIDLISFFDVHDFRKNKLMRVILRAKRTVAC